ncbi:type VI secretion system tube protein TssD [uncultured Culturomica sp.]|uniref:type VI secretion system tube protein TssD n=1 Tax=uncultured Culturomica sp. TaxID=1926654 RepID=UPI000334FEA1|nr:type VI secretion system tube protein TssD [uncultured Culturomica sp.]CCZ07008.1 uncharacterized protein BN783_02615 [Odoribacter sp. CAG:788]
MNITGAKLRINDSEFDIIQLNYGFYRKTDSKGRPVSGVRGGDIHVLIESDGNNYILRQMLPEEVPPVRGCIEVMTGQDKQRTRLIEFDQAYICSQSETMFAGSSYPMLMTIAITPVRLDIDRKIRLDRRWPETYGFWWQEYKPEERKYIKRAGTTEATPATILVTEVKGPDAALPSEETEYEVTNYNMGNVSSHNKAQIKWVVEVDGKKYKQTVQGEKIKLPIKKEWTGKEITVMPYLEKPTGKVSINTKVKKWQFPIIIDRYKMPGLNETGTDIADDMAYGYGFKSGRPVYNTLLTTRFKKSYERKHENNEVDPVLSNSADYDPASPVFQASPLDAKQKMERYIRIKNAKAIYSKEDFPAISSGIQEGIRFLRKGIDDFTDEELFTDFEQMAILAFSPFNSDMKENIVRMIEKFRQNKGGVYEDCVLTDYVRKHPSTLRYCDQLEAYIKKELQAHKGDISALEDIKVFFKKEGDKPDEISEKRANHEYHKKDFSLTPVYDAGFISFKNFGKKWEQIKNATQGYTIALNDIWSTEIVIKDYELNGNSYKGSYRVTLWDHFGLDAPDLDAGKVAAYGAGFRAWFILQHFRGYKPFITKITFDRTFKGEIQ